MKNNRLSQISVQILVYIILSILISETNYAIGKNQIFFHLDTVAGYFTERAGLVVWAVLCFLMVVFQLRWANLFYWGFYLTSFMVGIVDFNRSGDKLVLSVLFLSVIVGGVLAFIYGMDIKSAYRRGLIGSTDLFMTPKRQIKMTVTQKKNDTNEIKIAGLLSNWDANSGYFHSFQFTPLKLGRMELDVEFNGHRFKSMGAIVRINEQERSYGFVIEKDLSGINPSWHNFINLLNDLGFRAELIV